MDHKDSFPCDNLEADMADRLASCVDAIDSLWCQPRGQGKFAERDHRWVRAPTPPIHGRTRVVLQAADTLCSMQETLNLNFENRYNIITLVFFITYTIFQPVATVLTRKIGPRLFLSTLVVAWGAVMIVSPL